MPRLSINCEEILPRVHVDFEEKNKVFEPSAIIINYCITVKAYYNYVVGARGGVVVKALRYKLAGRGFDSRWCQDFSPRHNPVGRTMALGVDSASNRNEYQMCFLSSGMLLGVKAAGVYG